MKTHRIIPGVVFASALALAAPVSAQQGTVITTSGDRVSGHVRDMDRSGYTVLVDGGERRIMLSQIAAVDFGGGRDLNNDEVNKLRQGREVVVLKDGTVLVGNIAGYERTMEGKLADLPTSHAFRIQFNAEGGNRNFLSSEVARIYFKPTGDMPTGTTSQAPPPDETPTTTGANQIVVAANEQWTPTGISVVRGRTVRFESSGRIQLSGDANDVAEPSGAASGRRAPNAPVPDAPAGALIGRVGNSQPFVIPANGIATMPATGQLFLGVNDDGFNDNSGRFVVKVNAAGAARRR